MNIIAFIILAALFADLLLNGIADYLNIKHISNEVPHSFKDIYNDQRYGKSQEYLRVNTRFGWVVALFDICVLLIFWFSKGFQYLDQWLRSFQWPIVLTGLTFIGSLLLLRSLLSIPFGLYATFVIEEKFGFNKTTLATYVKDKLKGLILSIVFGVPILALVLTFFEYAGENAWWYCWTIVTLFMLIVQFIAPVWIMPLFNKFEPIEEGELKSAIVDYAGSIKFSLKNVYIMDGSKRSAKSNAFFTGFGKHKRIVLFDTLIQNHSLPELISILAHEMGHYKKRHIFKMLIIGILQAGLMFYILSYFISYQGLFDAFYVQEPSVYAGLIFFGMLYSPMDSFIGLFVQKISRIHEYEADRFAATTTSNPKSMIDALKKLSVDNLSNLLPHPFYVFLNYSHPPVLKRIEAIERVIVE